MTFDPYAPFIWRCAHKRRLTLGPSGVLMGILNVTPDSFSDGGKFDSVDTAVKQAKKMFRDGATIIDIGGESSRPGASELAAREEQGRVLPVIEELRDHNDMMLSIDTWRSSTAKKAIAAGAHIINDVWGFQRDTQIASVAAQTSAGCVIMHTGRERTKLDDPVKDQIFFLSQSLKVAKAAGVKQEQIVLDPGFGFAKDTDENVELLARMEELFTLGQPVLTGASRKRFIGAITGRGLSRRDIGTTATTVMGRLKGSAVFRVHDVAKNFDALQMTDAVINSTKD